jgi:YgiT-type zinc finger domain-containing protein
MKCIICKQAETKPGTVTVTLERNGATFVIKRVPAQICPNCGEEYVDEPTTAKLIAGADEAVRAGVSVNICEYAAA